MGSTQSKGKEQKKEPGVESTTTNTVNQATTSTSTSTSTSSHEPESEDDLGSVEDKGKEPLDTATATSSNTTTTSNSRGDVTNDTATEDNITDNIILETREEPVKDTTTTTTTTSDTDDTSTTSTGTPPPHEPETDVKGEVGDATTTTTTSSSTTAAKKPLQQYYEQLQRKYNKSLRKIQDKIRLGNIDPEEFIKEIIAEQVFILRNLRKLTKNISIWTSLHILEQRLQRIILDINIQHEAPLWLDIHESTITISDRFIIHAIFIKSLEYVSGLTANLFTLIKALNNEHNLPTTVILPSEEVEAFQKTLKKLYKTMKGLKHDPITLLGSAPVFAEVLSFFDKGMKNEDNNMFRTAVQTYIAFQDAHNQKQDFNEDKYWDEHITKSAEELRDWLMYLFRDATGAPNFIEKTKETKLNKRVITPLSESTQCTRISIAAGSGIVSLAASTSTYFIKKLTDKDDAETPSLPKKIIEDGIMGIAVLAVFVFVVCVVLMIIDCLRGCCPRRPDYHEPDEQTPLKKGNHTNNAL